MAAQSDPPPELDGRPTATAADIEHALPWRDAGPLEQALGDRREQEILHLLPFEPAAAARPVPVGHLVGVAIVDRRRFHRSSDIACFRVGRD